VDVEEADDGGVLVAGLMAELGGLYGDM